MYSDKDEFRANLKSTLQSNIMKITFMKKDGSERVINCTLKEEFLPARSESSKPRKENYSVLSVFDVDLKEWRSMIIDNIVEIEKASETNET